jgi:hypothetical protein
VSDGISDSTLQWTLTRFAAVAGVALDDPAAWLGREDTSSGKLAAAGGRRVPGSPTGRRIRRLLAGRRHPGNPGWEELPADQRARWWVRRLQAVAAPIAATPRVFGLLADRIPLQGAFGATAAGLAVCAVAREHGIREPAAWVPLLGRVLFDRDLSRPAESRLVVPPAKATPPHRGLVRRGAGMLWRLAWLLWDAQSVFDDRPRGPWLWRAVGKVPVVGLVGGLLDERGAVARAASEASRLITQAPSGVGRPDAAGRGAA